MSETKEEQAKRRWLAIQNELSPGETEIERTLDNIAVVRAGWHRVRSETGKWTYFPDVPRFPSGSKEARAAEDAWEARALAMHENQKPIHIEAKPQENAMTRIERGD